jgi:hypothetical protein
MKGLAFMSDSLHQQQPQDKNDFLTIFSQITCIDETGKINVELTESMRQFFGAAKAWADQHPDPNSQDHPQRNEKAIEIALGQSLEEQGIPVRYQVACDAGIADIVTPDAIYEIKDTLDRTSIYSALGQIIIYRQQINPQAKTFIVGRPSPTMRAKQREAIISSAQAMGVEIIFWKD